MLIDARTLPTDQTIETDVCIVGAGPAGIAVARELMGQNFRVCLLETGGLEPDAEIQSLAAAEGNTIGDAYPGAIHMRHRQFGGTSYPWNIKIGGNRRGVRYVPLDSIDFEKRDGVPYSGWPFDKSHLDPFYERAQTFCQLGPYAYAPEDWEDENSPRLPFTGNRITTKMFQCGPRDIYPDDYRKELEQASNITIYLHSTAVELETDDEAKTVKRVRVACLQGTQFWVSAKQFILSMGGIENARLLLLSDKVQKNGLGNQHDLVGRFLMDHPMVRGGFLYPSSPKIFNSTALYDLRELKGTSVIGKLSLSDEVLRREKLLNITAALFPRTNRHKINLLRAIFPNGKNYRSEAVSSAQALLEAARQKKIPRDLFKHLGNMITGLDDLLFFEWRKKPRLGWLFSLFDAPGYGFDLGGWSDLPHPEKTFGVFEVAHQTEQAPDPDNRVTLGTELDRLGCRKVKLYWRWTDTDLNSIKRAQEIFAEEIARAGLGTFKIARDKGSPVPITLSTHHHMGTTRMHVDPKQGVVDPNCQVHSVSNLFMAGSSVFPTGSFANPNLTIIAMSIRLADHIKKVMNQSPVVELQNSVK
ncbi:MAG: GMC family oxidoreductase [Microcoleus sp. SIO2G3]|nr:GMC family oxidoreductase [Microcoleus sp. SIO2G3]